MGAFFIAAGLAVLAVVLLRDAASLTQDGGYAGVGPADVPRMVAYGLLGLSVWTAIAAWRGDVPVPPKQDLGPVVWILLGLGLQLVTLHSAGFIIAGALLFACTARGLGQRNLPLALVVGLVLGTLIYGVFDKLLRLNLPGGPLEDLIYVTILPPVLGTVQGLWPFGAEAVLPATGG